MKVLIQGTLEMSSAVRIKAQGTAKKKCTLADKIFPMEVCELIIWKPLYLYAGTENAVNGW